MLSATIKNTFVHVNVPRSRARPRSSSAPPALGSGQVDVNILSELPRHVLRQDRDIPVAMPRADQAAPHWDLDADAFAAAALRRAAGALWEAMLRSPAAGKVDVQLGRILHWPCVTTLFPIDQALAQALRHLPNKLTDLAGPWLTPTPIESYHMTNLAGPAAADRDMSPAKWRAILKRSGAWLSCASFLERARMVPRMQLHRIRVCHGKITVYLRFMDDESADFMYDELKPGLYEIQSDVFERPDHRGTHMTISLKRYNSTPMPGVVEEAVVHAIEECFQKVGTPIPLSRAVLCLAPDMSRFVPWDGSNLSSK